MTKNKRRLYIAYLSRKATKENPIKFHTALLLSPKNPRVNSDEKVSKLFHVKDVLTSSGKPIWTFVVEEVQARPAQVVGIQLLSKIPDILEDQALQEILAGVPLSPDATDPTWRCRHWIWKAVDALVEHKLIAPIPHDQTSEGVWNLGYAFLENVNHGDPYQEVPSCDVNGQPIGSELGSFQR
ncbi:hypothetical protein M413DRAFT_338146 [Hebeloma cylindrosporum]|uniref:Uncharacterized protein n=1 Tax=Hebeloma cylindrosporum TaxID=76867 RepID=A0A0C2Y652_HEBCY|nr:hypothetical protein M413DRAFT_338146 [Hebeloma cylindrosporum h7]